MSACASGGSNEVNGSSPLDEGKGSGASAGRSVPHSPMFRGKAVRLLLGLPGLCLTHKVGLLDPFEKRSQIELG